MPDIGPRVTHDEGSLSFQPIPRQAPRFGTNIANSRLPTDVTEEAVEPMPQQAPLSHLGHFMNSELIQRSDTRRTPPHVRYAALLWKSIVIRSLQAIQPT